MNTLDPLIQTDRRGTATEGESPMRELDDVLCWTEEARPDHGISFLGSDGWEFWSYQRLAEKAGLMAGALAESGVEPEDVVVSVLPSGPQFVVTFFGAMLAGATVSPVAPAAVWHQSSQYNTHLTRVLGVARPKKVVAGANKAASSPTRWLPRAAS